MEDRQDDEEVELMVIGAVGEHVDAHPAKKRQIMKVAEKGGASSSSAAPTGPFAKFATDMAVAEKARAADVCFMKENVKTL